MAQWMGLHTYSIPVLCLLFFATNCRYNLIGFTVSADASSDKFVFAWKNRQALKGMAVLSGLGAVLSTLYLSWIEWLFVFHLGVLSFWYVFPIPGLSGSLRKKPYLKIFLIAYVWACSTWALPALHLYSIGDFDLQWELALAERFLFFFAITLPFDIRDISSDKDTQVLTVPLRIGVFNAQVLATILLIASSAIAYHQYTLLTFAGILPVNIIAVILVWISKEVSHDYYFLGIIDGTMILQLLAVYTSNTFFV